MQNNSKLIFVYNADSGISNALKDCLHKILSPKTYPCKLCDLTYGAFTERKKWKKFRTASKTEMIFLHADEFYSLYRSKFLPKYELPTVLLQNQSALESFIDKTALDNCKDLNAFITLVETRLRTVV